MKNSPAPLPPVVSADEWRFERDELLRAEKEATRSLDALAARRRRLPMTPVEKEYTFDTPDGPRSLLDLFDGRPQLVAYQFMDVGPDDFCPGCTNFTANVHSLDSLNATGVSWVTISNMPLAQIQAYQERMGWTMPFVSSRGTSFADDTDAGGGFGLNVFIRDGDAIYRTYHTNGRGVDRMLFNANILDLVPYGRQEEWEDSPAGWPQHPTYG
jgi:predicted dithiol-disulfide oxidoreductase (DUF899 family)